MIVSFPHFLGWMVSAFRSREDLILILENLAVYGELLFRQATWHATLLHPFLYVIDSKRALNFGEAQGNPEELSVK
jgi:hypothetical protein